MAVEWMALEKDGQSEVTDIEPGVIEKHVPEVTEGVLQKVTKDVPCELLEDTSDVPSVFVTQDVPSEDTSDVLSVFGT